MLKVRANSTINSVIGGQDTVEVQDIWMKVQTDIKMSSGHYQEQIGSVSILYVPDRFLISEVTYDSGLKIDSLAKNIAEELKSELQPKYFEIVITYPDGKVLFLNYGSDDGWQQVATFRFAEPRLG